MVTTASRMQQWLGTTAAAEHSERVRAVVEAPSFVDALRAGRASGWDPYEVWLDRIKRPRDDRTSPAAR